MHRSVQYSEAALPAMTRRIASGPLHCGQSESTAVAGEGVGLVSDTCMGCQRLSNQFKPPIVLRRCVSPELEPVDLHLGVRDGGIWIGPREADFERGKRKPSFEKGRRMQAPQWRAALAIHSS